MSRTPLFAALQRLAAQVAQEHSVETGAAQPGDVNGGRTYGTVNRRGVLLAGAAGLAAAATYNLARPTRALAAGSPRIVVIGAGLAGLSTAYQLKKSGYAATVYEAADQVGGRCWTVRGVFGDGQIAEHGGELIDQNHTDLLQLTQELGLTVSNLKNTEPAGTDELYWFDGGKYDNAQAKTDLQGIWQQLHNDVSAASYPTLYNSWTRRGWELDHMSVRDWINAYVPGGFSSRLGRLLDVAYNIEYGAETTDQSSLNLLYLLGYQGPGNFRMFGKSNEKYHVDGGNDRVATALAAKLPGQIQLGTALTALADRGDGTWSVTVAPSGGGRSTTVVADHVVLALPFSLLRQVDLSKANFPGQKTKAITQSAMGSNTKLQLQFARRSWYDIGCNGETYADTGYQNTWEVSRAQSGTSGVLVNYTGGTIARDFSSLTPSQYANRFLGQFEPVLPGITGLWNGRVSLDCWANYPWTKGAYSYWRVGGYTSICGSEREAVGSCHFAGEHTSVDFQGYLNGAVESGYRAASEIVAALK
ncbi:FAD-dependent oxidoreductase [Planosporangium thailandense]|uniref:FAD-dependent oxidoreductase n=1 Tax=Planosporangium thailandense TaxID=765197 RepID=A0ABX0XR68_9ACTN|nr:FAD-dependent oxidoreductase [Planosporangium thailandense]NJC68492.1 FAD-dependent oxidoreductase [Planosporangium thailandense]